jgi:CDP-paratose 2-epimerase
MLGARYTHRDIDIRDSAALQDLFSDLGSSVNLIVHTAAQPSHDWAARDPETDFGVNAVATLQLLEMCRRYAPQSTFIFTSTNKVYGDRPNTLPFVELETRWEVEPGHRAVDGIDETMSIDHSLHSLFGVSKTSADLMVQEYGRYFGLKTVCFRAGCLTGPLHAGTRLHGFLAYLMQCTITGTEYRIEGYKGKQVRDNIHSHDLVKAFFHFYQAPRSGAVYNIGGSRHSECSILEAISLCEDIAGKKLKLNYDPQNRTGDHIWYVSDVRKFRSDYPEWEYSYDLDAILKEIYEAQVNRLGSSP